MKRSYSQSLPKVLYLQCWVGSCGSSRRQVTVGGGYPRALHSRDTLVPSRTTRSPVHAESSMSGGTVQTCMCVCSIQKTNKDSDKEEEKEKYKVVRKKNRQKQPYWITLYYNIYMLETKGHQGERLLSPHTSTQQNLAGGESDSMHYGKTTMEFV